MPQGTLGQTKVSILRKPAKLLSPIKTEIDFEGVTIFEVYKRLVITPEDERAIAKLVVGYLGRDFSIDFLPKIESNIVPSKLQSFRLNRDSKGGQIIDYLGGECAVETTVAEMVDMMMRQGRGCRKGNLLTNGNGNVFYIRNASGVLNGVACRWLSEYHFWYIGSCSSDHSEGWEAGDRVFIRMIL